MDEKFTDPETIAEKNKLEEEKKQLESRKKEIENALKKIKQKKDALSVREETTRGMSFWRFFSTHRKEEYEAIIKSREFDEYLTSNFARRLFDFEELPVDESAKQILNVAYLNASYDDREAVKELGARWDPRAKSWYVPEGQSLEPFSRWLPAPAGPTNHEGEFRQEPENADL